MLRIAPTPSGFLHAGNAFSFLLTQRIARKTGQNIFLRIDDLDAARRRPEYIADIFESLNWLGIEWQAGPRDAADFERNWSQTLRREHYNKALQSLIDRKLVFACECSRKNLRAHNGRYPAVCQDKKIPPDRPETSLRLLVPAASRIEFTDEHSGRQTVDLGRVTGSFVVRRRDGLPAYHLASLIDDITYKITYIVRGVDLLHSTAAQLYLAEKTGDAQFGKIIFLHHELLPDELGRKLSKSEGASSLKAMRNAGMTGEDLVRELEPLIRKYCD